MQIKIPVCLWLRFELFNDFTIKNFASFITMALIIARKVITTIFGTMALQLSEVFHCFSAVSEYGPYYKSSLELKSNSNEILPVNCKFLFLYLSFLR